MRTRRDGVVWMFTDGFVANPAALAQELRACRDARVRVAGLSVGAPVSRVQQLFPQYLTAESPAALVDGVVLMASEVARTDEA